MIVVLFLFLKGWERMKVNKALLLIDHHTRKYYKKPERYFGMDKYKFAEQSYKHWAATEIRDYISNHRNHEPTSAIEEFAYAMDNFACAAKDSKKNFMFSVAHDVALDFLDMLLSEG